MSDSSSKKPCNNLIYDIIVIKLKEIFISFNSLYDTRINIICKVISQDIMAFKHTENSTEHSSSLQLRIADDTGCLKLLCVDSTQCSLMEIGNEIILRNVLVTAMANSIYIICDKNSVIIPSNDNLLNPSSIDLKCDYSLVKLGRLNYNII